MHQVKYYGQSIRARLGTKYQLDFSRGGSIENPRYKLIHTILKLPHKQISQIITKIQSIQKIKPILKNDTVNFINFTQISSKLSIYFFMEISLFVQQEHFIDNLVIDSFNIDFDYYFDNYQRMQQERTQKLLILVGEEGPNLEARDFNKIMGDIVENYIGKNNETYNQNFEVLFRKVITLIPLKQHIYAGLVPGINKINPTLALRIIENIIVDLQQSIKSLQIYKSINILTFLAQLMNISFINSLNYLNLLEDISIFMENAKNPQHRQFFVQLITRTLPTYCYSLNEKVSHDFKKFIERVRKYCGGGKNLLFAWILEQYHKRTLTDYSLMNRLQYDFSQIQQIQINFKIQLKVDQNKAFQAIEYYFPSPEQQKQSNKLYQQFVRTEATLHLYNFEQIIQSFTGNKTFLNQKLQAYLKYYDSSFIYRFVIEMLVAKNLRAKNSIVEPMIIVKLIEASQPGAWQSSNDKNVSFQQITENVLLHYFHKQSQNFDVNTLYKFTDLFSVIINNLSDNAIWDWERYVIDYNNKEQEQYKNRKVILKLVLQKIVLMNDRYRPESCLSIYHPPEIIKNQLKFKNVRDMEMYERFVEHIKSKADSEQIMSKFQDPKVDYQIFLQALLQKCSISHTHLQILMSRYQGIFQKNKEEYDWTLITKIRSFWRKSLYHRLLYLSWIIQHGYCDFRSYVKYIGKVQTDNEEQQLWIKIQLNELNKKYSNLLQPK